MSGEIVIRKGSPADVPAALGLVKELAIYEKAPREVEVTVEEMTQWGFGKEALFEFFVAEVSGTIQGIALYYYKYSTWKGKCLFLEDIIVTEAQRQRGIGRQLFNTVARVAREQGVRRMEWQVLEWNQPAIAFYNTYNAVLDGEWLNCKLTYEQLQNLNSFE